MAILCSLFVLFSIVAAEFQNVEFSKCADGTVEPQLVAQDPNPARIGKRFDLKISGNASEAITQGKFTISLKFQFFQVFSTEGDLCKILSCPVGPGPISATLGMDIPEAAPPLSYEFKVEFKDGDKELMCITTDLKLQYAANEK